MTPRVGTSSTSTPASTSPTSTTTLRSSTTTTSNTTSTTLPSSTATTSTTSTTLPPTTTTEAFSALDLTPGEGTGLTMCRAPWESGHLHAEILRLVVMQAGFTVSDPADLVLSHEEAYRAIALGDCDLWANAWVPLHEQWLGEVLDDSNPLGLPGGEEHGQGAGFTELPAEVCLQPCQLGWEPISIQVAVRSDVLEAEPVLRSLLASIRPTVLEVSELAAVLDGRDWAPAGLREVVESWHFRNADQVEEWVRVALEASQQ